MTNAENDQPTIAASRQLYEEMRGAREHLHHLDTFMDGGLDYQTALSIAAALELSAQQVRAGIVRVARANGSSWADVAHDLGITKQAAWEQFRDVD